MTEAQICRLDPLRLSRLDRNHYLQSLLQAGLAVGLITAERVGQVQLETIGLLNELVLRFSSGESSSVRVEVAQNILLSVFYCLDSYLLGLGDPETALACLQAESISRMHSCGLEQVRAKLQTARRLWLQVRASMLDVPQLAYTDTINQAIPEFLDSYDPLFAAHETMGSLDYPLALPEWRQTGINFLAVYLQRLQQENLFCASFSIADVRQLLYRHGCVYGLDYREALINIFEVVANNAVLAVIGAERGSPLLISPGGARRVETALSGLPEERLSALVNEVAIQVSRGLPASVVRYLQRYLSREMLPRLSGVLHDGGVERFVIEQE